MKILGIIALASLLPFAAGCATPGDKTAWGAGIGTVLGAGAGAIIGSHSGEGVAGAAIGAGFGALAGGLIGNALDGVDEEIEESRMQTEAAVYPASGPCRLSILDVIRMSQAGVTDGLIMTKIDQAAATYDLSANDIIDLRRSGVSERVIQHMLIRSPRPYYTRAEERSNRRVITRTVRIRRAFPVSLSARTCFN